MEPGPVTIAWILPFASTQSVHPGYARFVTFIIWLVRGATQNFQLLYPLKTCGGGVDMALKAIQSPKFISSSKQTITKCLNMSNFIISSKMYYAKQNYCNDYMEACKIIVGKEIKKPEKDRKPIPRDSEKSERDHNQTEISL